MKTQSNKVPLKLAPIALLRIKRQLKLAAITDAIRENEVKLAVLLQMGVILGKVDALAVDLMTAPVTHGGIDAEAAGAEAENQVKMIQLSKSESVKKLSQGT